MNTEQEKYIKENYLKISAKALGENIGLSKSVVLKFKKKNNLVVPEEIVKKWRSKDNWTTFTQEEDNYIKENLLTQNYSELANNLGRSKYGISTRIKRLGLIIPKEVMDERRKVAQFKSGDIPKNKGLKQSDYMSAEQIEKTKGTRFKKGDRPVNYNPVGHISKRKDSGGRSYYHIKIKEDKGVHSVENYIELHRYIWIKENGPIPKNGIIAFIDGDSLNCEPINLELITMRKNMTRNSGAINLPDSMIASYLSPRDKELQKELLKRPDLIELKRQSIKLNREINENT